VVAAGLVIVVGVGWIYAPVAGFPFLDLDDVEYVAGNPAVLGGLSFAGARWALTTFHAANWHPLTWLSHQVDVELFGDWAGGHHLVNVALHGLNAVLLLVLLARATGAVLPSAVTAALFAAHPLRVESVAWLAERKDLLCALFWLAGALAYLAWVRRRTPGRALGVILLMAAAAMSKPMAVGFPISLLMLDWWPLGRLRSGRDLAARLLEKLPLLAMSVLVGAITVLAQSASGATARLVDFSLGQRLANAPAAVATYVAQTVWPVGLAFFYPHPASLGAVVPTVEWAVAGLAIAAGTALAAVQGRKRPWLGAGWLWFCVLVVPVLGLIQVGSQSHADRYTYLPSIGLLFAVVWTVEELAARFPTAGRWRGAVWILVVVALAIASRQQVKTWRSPRSLYLHAIEVTESNWLAWNNLGVDHLAHNELVQASECFSRALELHPDYPDARYNRGLVLHRSGQLARAIVEYRIASELEPGNRDAWLNQGLAWLDLGRPDLAAAPLRQVLVLNPEDAQALANLILAEARAGRPAEARAVQRTLEALDPGLADQVDRRLRELRVP
jgi:Tfp pilus assembly protein PilF